MAAAATEPQLAEPPAVTHDAVSPARSVAPVTCQATRRGGPIAVDGKLDDDGWRNAVRNDSFTQRFPNPGARPTVDTEFAVVYDDDAFYIAVWANDREPALVRGLLTRRDQESPSDWVTISIDSYRDRRTAFAFGLNPASVQRDVIVFDDAKTDDSWDAVWSGAAAVTGAGWQAEFRVPLSQLRFSSQEARQQWGFQVTRVVARTGEEMSWSPWPRSVPQIVSRFGVVAGIERVHPGRRVELLPYATAGLSARPVAAGDPLHDKVTPAGNLGFDVKYGLSSAFSVAATINPDFGQVEADPSQVNLTTNELFLPEKRPFFLDGVELFKLGLGQGDDNAETLFYSRRIGAAPHGTPDGAFVNTPTSTTIYGAAKVSGKTPGGWSLGLLDAVTAREDATVQNAGGVTRVQMVEPVTNFAVAKLKRDLRDGKTTLDASVTAVNRQLSDTGLAEQLHDQAYSGGFELQHRFLDDRVSLSAKLLGSYVHGSPAAIALTQQLPRHLYQRPDGHVTFDPRRTSLVGTAVVSDIGYRGKHWQAATGFDLRTPGLEVNDLGFQIDADQYSHWGRVSYRDDDPGDLFLSYQVNGNLYSASDLAPRMLYVGGDINGNAQLKNYWRVDGGLEIAHNRWQNTALRGGPSLRQDNRAASWLTAETDSRKSISMGINLFYRTIPASSSFKRDAGVFARVQAASNVEIVAEPSISMVEDDAQYIDQVQDDAGQTRYLVGRIRQTSASLTLRASWTLSPRLSLQAYAQPFLATGAYATYKEVTQPGARSNAARFSVLDPTEYRVLGDTIVVDRDGNGVPEYAFPRPDFGLRELRSTLVVRWEYRPGSSVFAIWTHGRSSSDGVGELGLGGGLSRLARAEAENIVMVKANYWIGL